MEVMTYPPRAGFVTTLPTRDHRFASDIGEKIIMIKTIALRSKQLLATLKQQTVFNDVEVNPYYSSN